jgi:hypothetical protein
MHATTPRHPPRSVSGVRSARFLAPLSFLLLLAPLALLPACGSGRISAVLPSREARLEISSSRIEANDAFVEVRFRVTGAAAPDPATAVTYLLDEESGERFYTMKLQRAGKIPEGEEGGPAHSVLFKNRDGILRPGSKVVLVVGTLRKEHVLKER